MRTVREPAGMQRHHAGVDIVAREEIAAVIEQHLVVIVVRMEERHLERAGIGLERSRHEGADDEAGRQKRGMRRRRQMHAMAHKGADIAPIEPHGQEIAVPANRVQGIVGIGDGRERVAALDAHRPFLALALGGLLRLEDLIDRGHVEDGGIEDRRAAHQALLREPIAVVCGLDHEEHRGPLALEAPLRAVCRQTGRDSVCEFRDPECQMRELAMWQCGYLRREPTTESPAKPQAPTL